MYTKRLNRLIEQTAVCKCDVLALMPGANLFYITGLSFHLSERPIVALLPVDRRPAIVLPALEAVKVEQASIELDVFPYRDEEGYATAFQSACAALELADCTIGVEALRMRLLEVRLLQLYAPGHQLVPAEDVLAGLRVRKDQSELEQMRRAVAVTEAALRSTVCQVRAGMTESEVAVLLTVELYQAGGEGVAFPPIVVAGPNAASPHSTPTHRPIGPGETLVIDCGATVGGYAADITRTFAIGALEPELANVYEVVQAANAAGLGAAGPGVPAEEVDRAARAVIAEAGYGEYFIHRTGHGLGLEVYEAPFIVAGNRQLLEPGMTFTVEPGIYLPGRGGVRIEDDVLVTPSGVESLTAFPRQFASL